MTSFSLFDTALGTCAIAWRGGALVGVLLPSSTPEGTRAQLLRAFPDGTETAPTPPHDRTVARVQRLLEHGDDDLADVEVDLSGLPDLQRRVYEHIRTVPPGRTTTYGAVADALGLPPGSARAVGQAMGSNPCPIVVPCHRVLAANGHGSFSAPGGVDTKLRMLVTEGAVAEELPLF